MCHFYQSEFPLPVIFGITSKFLFFIICVTTEVNVQLPEWSAYDWTQFSLNHHNQLLF